MSKGTQVKGVRIPADLQAEIELTIARRNVHSTLEPWEFTAFVLTAIREKIAKMERSRNRNVAQGKSVRPVLSSANALEDANAVS